VGVSCSNRNKFVIKGRKSSDRTRTFDSSELHHDHITVHRTSRREITGVVKKSSAVVLCVCVAEQRRVDAADPPGRPAARVIMARISYTAPNTTHGRHLFGSRRPRPTDTDPTVLPSPILSLSRSRSKRIQTKLASFFLPRGIPSLRRSA
jgi:hypothetical protein